MMVFLDYGIINIQVALIASTDEDCLNPDSGLKVKRSTAVIDNRDGARAIAEWLACGDSTLSSVVPGTR